MLNLSYEMVKSCWLYLVIRVSLSSNLSGLKDNKAWCVSRSLSYTWNPVSLVLTIRTFFIKHKESLAIPKDIETQHISIILKPLKNNKGINLYFKTIM